jgi:hypothetical protein
MSIALDRRCFTVSLAMPAAQALSVWIVVVAMSHFLECNAEWDTVASVVEYSAEFGLSGRGQDVPHNGADGVNGAIVWYVGSVRAP